MNILVKKLKKGSTDALAIMCLTPLIIILMGALTSIIQISVVREKIEYTTYVAARAAALSYSEDDYQDNAQEVAWLDIVSDEKICEYIDQDFGEDGVKCDVSIVEGGTFSETRPPEGARTGSFRKGNFIKCTVTVRVKPAISIVEGKNAEKSFTIYMAIEKPDTSTDLT